jgi:hypothetical protein
MNDNWQTAFREIPKVYGDVAPIDRKLIAEQRDQVAAWSEGASVKTKMLAENRIVMGAGTSRIIVRPATLGASFEGKIFGSLVALKVALSYYAMHLSADERHRICEQLDSIINTEDWHEEDELPKLLSFQDFLKWMIYSRYFKWTSIGVSNEGNILVAWKTDRVLLTANFEGAGNVRWAAKVTSGSGEVGHSVGSCPLRLFAEQALFYLRQAMPDDDQLHQ